MATKTQKSQKFSPVTFCDFCVFVAVIPFLQWTHKYETNSIAISPDGQKLASAGGSPDPTIRLWQISDGTLLNTIDSDTSMTDLAFSPDGQILASGDENRSIRLWSAESGQLLKSLEGHKSRINAIVFSADGRVLVSSDRSSIRFWQTSSGQQLQTIEGGAQTLAFSPDTEILAGGRLFHDRTLQQYRPALQLWHAGNGELLQTYDVETGTNILSLAFSTDGKYLAYGREDATVVLAENPVEHLLESDK